MKTHRLLLLLCRRKRERGQEVFGFGAWFCQTSDEESKEILRGGAQIGLLDPNQAPGEKAEKDGESRLIANWQHSHIFIRSWKYGCL